VIVGTRAGWLGAAIVLLFGAGCRAPAQARRPAIALTGGRANLDANDDEVTVFQAEGRWRPLTPLEVVPACGLFLGTDGAWQAYGELRRDFWFAERWAITPYGGYGYWEDGDDLVLDYRFEYRAGVELSRLLSDRLRLSIAYLHLSNGGQGSTNPGSQIALVGLTWYLGG
jgi:lipid A 3-O-deacylase